MCSKFSILFQLGNHPLLSLRELAAIGVTGKRVHPHWLRADTPPQYPTKCQNDPASILRRLGGTISIAVEAFTLPGQLPQELDASQIKRLQQTLTTDTVPPSKTKHQQNGKKASPRIGISFSTTKSNYRQLRLFARSIEQKIGQPILTNQKNYSLSAAETQDILNTGGTVLHAIEQGNRWIFARSIAVQDAEHYAQRDIERPHLLKRTGMMPPKLAQMLINIAIEGKNAKTERIVDPFCGAGTILQEAMLMGIPSAGIDLDPRTINLARENITWSAQTFHSAQNTLPELKHGNALDINVYKAFAPITAIVSEGELGKNHTHAPNFARIATEQAQLHKLYTQSLRTFAAILPKGGRIALCFPVWLNKNKAAPISLFDNLQPSLASIRSLRLIPHTIEGKQYDTLLYQRGRQFVGRQIALFEKIR